MLTTVVERTQYRFGWLLECFVQSYWNISNNFWVYSVLQFIITVVTNSTCHQITKRIINIAMWKYMQVFMINIFSRYYATFKVRKIDLFCRTNIFLQRNTTCFGLQAQQILLCYFQKLQLLVVKKFWNNFCSIALLFGWAQKVCLRFLKSYFKLEILILLAFLGSFFLLDMFN